jgi:hypothetical protein
MPSNTPPPPGLPTPPRQRACFLRYFAQCGSVTEAATRAGIAARTVRRWRDSDPAFARRYDEVRASRLELLEDLAMRRASGADCRPVFHGGKQVATVERHNDMMLMRVLARFDKLHLREQAWRHFDAEVDRKVAIRSEGLRREYEARRERLEREFDARVQREVKKRLSNLSASSGQVTAAGIVR